MEAQAIVIADTDGVIQLWSRGAETLFGHKASDTIGQTLDLIVPAPFRERHWAGFRAAMSSGQAKLDGAAANIPVLRQDGQVVAFPATLKLLRDARGEIIGAMAIYRPQAAGESALPTLT